jgi:hypothetical protein
MAPTVEEMVTRRQRQIVAAVVAAAAAVVVAAAAAVAGNDYKGSDVAMKTNGVSVLSILRSPNEAVCPDGLIVPAIFGESDFYCNSLKCY